MNEYQKHYGEQKKSDIKANLSSWTDKTNLWSKKSEQWLSVDMGGIDWRDHRGNFGSSRNILSWLRYWFTVYIYLPKLIRVYT